jgi:hypothetical protein
MERWRRVRNRHATAYPGAGKAFDQRPQRKAVLLACHLTVTKGEEEDTA